MKNDRLFLALGIICLVGLGMLTAQIFPRSAGVVKQGFGEGLWRWRRLDLMVQVGLVFVGALGIRALLPEEDETE